MNKTTRLVIFALVALAQLAVPAWAMRARLATLNHGRVWKLRCEPIDPPDVIRGRYVRLSFTAQRFPMAQAPGEVTSAWVTLKEGKDGFAQVDQFSKTPLNGDNVIKVEPQGWYESMERVRFPFEHFWMNEERAMDAEKAYLELIRNKKENVYVTIRVRDGDSALEQLFIDDKPIAQYVREHAAP